MCFSPDRKKQSLFTSIDKMLKWVILSRLKHVQPDSHVFYANNMTNRPKIEKEALHFMILWPQNKLYFGSITVQPHCINKTIYFDSIRHYPSSYYRAHCIVYMVEGSISSSKCSSFDWISHYGHRSRSTLLSPDCPNRLLSEDVHLFVFVHQSKHTK